MDPDPDAVGAQLTATGQAVPALSAHDVTLGSDDLAGIDGRHSVAQLHDLADELVADDQGWFDGVLRPLVPALDVEVGAADAGAQDADQDFAGTRARVRDLL
jgi:hypothetical protein